MPSVAVAYIENRKIAWTAVYGEQSPGVAATKKMLYNMASLTKPITGRDNIATRICRETLAGRIDVAVLGRPCHKTTISRANC